MKIQIVYICKEKQKAVKKQKKILTLKSLIVVTYLLVPLINESTQHFDLIFFWRGGGMQPYNLLKISKILKKDFNVTF